MDEVGKLDKFVLAYFQLEVVRNVLAERGRSGSEGTGGGLVVNRQGNRSFTVTMCSGGGLWCVAVCWGVANANTLLIVSSSVVVL